MRDYAVNAYVQFDQASDLMVFLGSTPENTEARIGYADVAVGKDRALADTFRSASEDAAFARADLQSQREKQNQLQAQVSAAKNAAEQAVTAQQRALSKVQGQLATLVKQEQARRAAEAAQGGSSPPAAEPLGPCVFLDCGAQRAGAVGGCVGRDRRSA